MRALIYGGPGNIQCESVQDPILSDQDGAIVKTTLCSICGSDLHPYHLDLGHSGYCIGHEAVGEVIEVGRNVKTFAVGDRVLVPASLGCGLCLPCRQGNVVLCQTHGSHRVFGQGVPGIGGCQAEAIAVPVADSNLYRLADGVSDEVGIMLTDNLATAWYGARRARVGPGDVVAVIGLGAVGLQCVASALAMGAARVLAIDLLADRRALAVKLGAESIDAPDVAAAVLEATKGAGVDVVLDANGGPVTTALAIELVGRGGRVSVLGVSEKVSIAFPILTALRKNLEFHTGVCSVQAELPVLMREIESGRLNSRALSEIITHRMGLSEGSEAYAMFNARKDGMVKVVLDPTR
ncbi:MAG: alcohol dehydrogenase catalytic domain-containing protein [Sulfuricaulis sp.]|nr:alcohol dehydrogenase catalytic domain-containing protein [Sulfuricaulis sp.]